MKVLDLLRLSTSNLFKRKMRTILTVLGVTIGVASIVVMISLGLGLSRSLTEEMSSYGSHCRACSPPQCGTGGSHAAGGRYVKKRRL